MMRTRLYGADLAALDRQARIRMDDWELREDVPQTCHPISGPPSPPENLSEAHRLRRLQAGVPAPVRFRSGRKSITMRM